MTVNYSVPALVRANVVRKGGALQFVTKADPAEAVGVLREAAIRATAPFLGPDMDEEYYISVSGCAAAPDGPIVVLAVCDSPELLEAWLVSVAADLEQAGLSGRIQAAKSVETPRINAPMMTAGIALQVETDSVTTSHRNNGTQPDLAWCVSEERTSRVLPGLISWCLDGPGEVHLHAGVGMDLAPEDIEPIVMSSVGAETSILLQRMTEDRRHLRRLELYLDGEVICTTYDADQDWPDRLRSVQQPLRHAAPDALYAFARVAAPLVSLIHVWRYPPKVPYIAEGGHTSVRLWPYNTLFDRYVPDAYPQQVLTTAHLDRIGELSPERWQVEPLAADRYLVSARDMSPWLNWDPTPYGKGDNHYARDAAPGPEVLAQARADFAPALMTTTVVAEHPPLASPHVE